MLDTAYSDDLQRKKHEMQYYFHLRVTTGRSS